MKAEINRIETGQEALTIIDIELPSLIAHVESWDIATTAILAVETWDSETIAAIDFFYGEGYCDMQYNEHIDQITRELTWKY